MGRKALPAEDREILGWLGGRPAIEDTDAPRPIPHEDFARWFKDPVVFIETFCRLTQGRQRGQLIQLRDWQKEIIHELITPEGKKFYRRALLGMPRKQGKSILGAGLALWALCADEPGAQVYSAAGSLEQARVVFAMAADMAQLDSYLKETLKVYRNVLYFKESGSLYRCLAAEAPMQEGLSPSMVLVDELHTQPDRKLYDVLQLASGTREAPMLLAITTAGVMSDRLGHDTICYELYQYGRRVQSGEVDDPDFYFHWLEPADPQADWRDEAVWRECNPALGDFLRIEDFRAAVRTTPESEFRIKRLCQWVSGLQAALPYGAWEACAEPERVIEDGTEVTIGFDGSFSGDCTVLVGATIEEIPHLFVIDCFERPDWARDDWRVPIAEVEASIEAACRRWAVIEVAADPFRWQRSLQALDDLGLPILEYPSAQPSKAVKAWKILYDAIVDRRLTHDGDPRFARHMSHIAIKTDHLGPRPVKMDAGAKSRRHIDLGIAAMMAFDRASQQGSSIAIF